ncbi:MAG: cupredoxin domain-containing protein [Vicinamibacterales bacterium]
MIISRRTVGPLFASAGVLLLAGPEAMHLMAASRSAAGPWPAAGQERAPIRRELTIVVKDFRYAPARIEVTQDDLITLTVRSEDLAHTFTLDEYRIARRVAPGSTTTFEFRADRAGTFPFYCNLTSEPGHAQERGQLVVRPR